MASKRLRPADPDRSRTRVARTWHRVNTAAWLKKGGRGPRFEHAAAISATTLSSMEGTSPPACGSTSLIKAARAAVLRNSRHTAGNWRTVFVATQTRSPHLLFGCWSGFQPMSALLRVIPSHSGSSVRSEHPDRLRRLLPFETPMIQTRPARRIASARSSISASEMAAKLFFDILTALGDLCHQSCIWPLITSRNPKHSCTCLLIRACRLPGLVKIFVTQAAHKTRNRSIRYICQLRQFRGGVTGYLARKGQKLCPPTVVRLGAAVGRCPPDTGNIGSGHGRCHRSS